MVGWMLRQFLVFRFKAQPILCLNCNTIKEPSRITPDNEDKLKQQQNKHSTHL